MGMKPLHQMKIVATGELPEALKKVVISSGCVLHTKGGKSTGRVLCDRSVVGNPTGPVIIYRISNDGEPFTKMLPGVIVLGKRYYVVAARPRRSGMDVAELNEYPMVVDNARAYKGRSKAVCEAVVAIHDQYVSLMATAIVQEKNEERIRVKRGLSLNAQWTALAIWREGGRA